MHFLLHHRAVASERTDSAFLNFPGVREIDLPRNDVPEVDSVVLYAWKLLGE